MKKTVPQSGWRVPRAGFLVTLLASTVHGATLDFTLLAWGDGDATLALPSAAGRKPSAPAPVAGDWLIFSADDAALPAANNPAGAFSHNFVDLTAAGGPVFNLAPSLTGSLSIQFEPAGVSAWTVSVSALEYQGQANAMQAMNQHLVKPGDPATQNPAFQVDGLSNAGWWSATASNAWAIQYSADFYFAANSDGDPSPADIDATFNDKTQKGFLIPVNQLTTDGLAQSDLADPEGFHNGDFKAYLLDELAPRLPANATYLLLTQMSKVHPDYAEPGLPITTAGLIGNTTIAFTTQTLIEPPRILAHRIAEGRAVIEFTGAPAYLYQIEWSRNLTEWQPIEGPALTAPEPGILEWSDSDRDQPRKFYRVIAVAP